MKVTGTALKEVRRAADYAALMKEETSAELHWKLQVDLYLEHICLLENIQQGAICIV